MGFGGGHTRQKAENRANIIVYRCENSQVTYLFDNGKAGDIVSDRRELRPAHAGRSEVLVLIVTEDQILRCEKRTRNTCKWDEKGMELGMKQLVCRASTGAPCCKRPSTMSA
jgi:hypothetical protein